MNEPIGDLCILRNEEVNLWEVFLCRGKGRRDVLQQFETREEAASFAASERERLRAQGGLAVDIHFPDDCPCLCPEPAKRSSAG
jgi:hypothetical protein